MGKAVLFTRALPCNTGQYNYAAQNESGFKGNKKFINDYTVSDIQPTIKLSLHPMTRLFDRPVDKYEVLYVFLQWLSLISGTKLLEINKHAIWIDALSVFRLFSTPHFYICHFFLRYCGICYRPMFPSCRK